MTKFSYAKINLSLNVINKKRPEGLHSLDMVNVCINLKDTIKIKFFDDQKKEITIICNNENVPTNKDNLVYKVVEKFQKQFNLNFSCIIKINKQIPVSAGLAGGSSNAATTLEILDKKYKTNMTMLQKMRFLEPITSDGPFLLVKKLSRVKGNGNIIEPINKKLKGKLFIVKPKKGCNTKDVFSNLSYANLNHPNINKVIDSLIQDDLNSFKKHVGNSLLESAIKLNEDVLDVLNRLTTCGFEVCMMSGSGSTCYAYSKSKSAYKLALSLFKKENYDIVGVFKII